MALLLSEPPALRLAIGEKEVASRLERGSCFQVGAVLSRGTDRARESVPDHESRRRVKGWCNLGKGRSAREGLGGRLILNRRGVSRSSLGVAAGAERRRHCADLGLGKACKVRPLGWSV
jgi:hypothetical protein